MIHLKKCECDEQFRIHASIFPPEGSGISDWDDKDRVQGMCHSIVLLSVRGHDISKIRLRLRQSCTFWK